MTRDQAGEILKRERGRCEGIQGSRHGSVFLANHTGDECIATFQPGVAESVTVAQGKLTEFLEACVTRYGSSPPVWQRPIGETEFRQFNPEKDSILQADEIMLQYPLAGG